MGFSERQLIFLQPLLLHSYQKLNIHCLQGIMIFAYLRYEDEISKTFDFNWRGYLLWTGFGASLSSQRDSYLLNEIRMINMSHFEYPNQYLNVLKYPKYGKNVQDIYYRIHMP